MLDVKGYPGDVVQKRGEVPPGLNRKCLREERPTASDSSHKSKPRETWGGRMATAAGKRRAAPRNAGYGHGWHAQKRRIKTKGKSHRVKENKTKENEKSQCQQCHRELFKGRSPLCGRAGVGVR